MNYGLSVIEFVLLLMQMIDTVYEGNGGRQILQYCRTEDIFGPSHLDEYSQVPKSARLLVI